MSGLAAVSRSVATGKDGRLPPAARRKGMPDLFEVLAADALAADALITIIAKDADRALAEHLADRLNDVLGGTPASTAFLAIAFLLANVPLPPADRLAAYGALARIADGYATQLDRHGTAH